MWANTSWETENSTKQQSFGIKNEVKRLDASFRSSMFLFNSPI